MKKFIVLYSASGAAMEKMEQAKNASPEEAAKGMEAWKEWAGKVGDGLVDLGTPLGNAQNVTEKGATPATSQVVGYSVLQAESMEAAVKMLDGHPHLSWDEGCEIEVHESLPMPS